MAVHVLARLDNPPARPPGSSLSLDLCISFLPNRAEPGDWSGFWPGVVRGIEDAKHRGAPAPVPVEKKPVKGSLDDLLVVYEELLGELAARNVAWVQIDEPCLTLDLDDTLLASAQAHATVVEMALP